MFPIEFLEKVNFVKSQQTKKKIMKNYPTCKEFYRVSSVFQVSLWKETLEGQWVCISDVKKGQGQVTDGQMLS